MPLKTSIVSPEILKDFFDTSDHHMVTIGLMKTQFCFRRASVLQKKEIKTLESDISATIRRVQHYKRHKLTGPQVKALKTQVLSKVNILRKLVVDTCYIKHKKFKLKDMVWKKKSKSLYELQAPDKKPVSFEEGQILADGLEVKSKLDDNTYEIDQTTKCTSRHCRMVNLFNKGNKNVIEKVVMPIVNRTWKLLKYTTSGTKNMSTKMFQFIMDSWGYILLVVICALKYNQVWLLKRLNPELLGTIKTILDALVRTVGLVFSPITGAQVVKELNATVQQNASFLPLFKIGEDVKVNSSHFVDVAVQAKQASIIVALIFFAKSILPYVLDAEKRKGLPRLPSFPKVTFDSTRKMLNKYKYPIIFVLMFGAGVGTFKFQIDKQFLQYVQILRESPAVKEGFQNFTYLVKKLGKNEDEFFDAKEPSDEWDEIDALVSAY